MFHLVKAALYFILKLIFQPSWKHCAVFLSCCYSFGIKTIFPCLALQRPSFGLGEWSHNPRRDKYLLYFLLGQVRDPFEMHSSLHALQFKNRFFAFPITIITEKCQSVGSYHSNQEQLLLTGRWTLNSKFLLHFGEAWCSLGLGEDSACELYTVNCVSVCECGWFLHACGCININTNP